MTLQQHKASLINKIGLNWLPSRTCLGIVALKLLSELWVDKLKYQAFLSISMFIFFALYCWQ